MALKARVLGQASSQQMSSQSNADLVTTATLLRGRVYFYKGVKFELNEPIIVEEKMAHELEEIHGTVKDGDGDWYEKPFFHVQRGVPRPAEAPDPSKARRQAVRLPVKVRMPTTAAR